MARPKASASEWAARVRGWRESGEPARGYAERRWWNARTLTWWGSRLRCADPTTVPFVRVVARDDGARSPSGPERRPTGSGI